ncbi:MAG: hypothetical protein LBK99_23885 [Opitutaceae bacterium]|jgi:hypothetical protein|nr:hypothetical protein [Opitutaceae bacterium]
MSINIDTTKYQAAEAIKHMLGRIRDVPAIGWHCGYGTSAFEKLVKAYCALTGDSEDAVLDAFEPRNAADPYKGRIAWNWLDECDPPGRDRDVLVASGNDYDTPRVGRYKDGRWCNSSGIPLADLCFEVVAWADLPENPTRKEGA